MNVLANHLSSYLQLRRQLGFKLINTELFLRNFVRFIKEQHASFITTKLAFQWATQPENIRPRQRAVRLGIVRRFAEYVSTLDRRTEVPPPKLLQIRYRRPAPYLYRDEEVLKLIKAAGQIGRFNALRRATYSTLFGLLAVTGMRVGEAITLDRADVDLEQLVLTLRRAKGNKSRLVPLHPSTGQALRRYADIRDKHCPRPSSATFFVTN